MYCCMKTITINCFLCKTPFEKFKGEYDRQIRNGKDRFFCSQKCVREHIQTTNIKIGSSLRTKNEISYYKSPTKCLQCGDVILYDSRTNRFCSQKCGATYSQKDGGHFHSDKDKKRISKSLKKFYENNPELKKVYKQKLKCRVNIVCKICKNSFETIKCQASTKKYCSFKCYVEDMKRGYLKGKSGGYRERGGRGKQGWYKGYYCHSTWELAWIIYQLEHNVTFVRNTEGFEYVLDGKIHKFYPDFIVNGEYVEIKGWDNGQVNAKITQFPHKLIILRSNEIMPYLMYAKSKYGEELEKLYEKTS